MVIDMSEEVSFKINVDISRDKNGTITHNVDVGVSTGESSPTEQLLVMYALLGIVDSLKLKIATKIDDARGALGASERKKESKGESHGKNSEGSASVDNKRGSDDDFDDD
jgi:hypothetical protein